MCVSDCKHFGVFDLCVSDCKHVGVFDLCVIDVKYARFFYLVFRGVCDISRDYTFNILESIMLILF